MKLKEFKKIIDYLPDDFEIFIEDTKEKEEIENIKENEKEDGEFQDIDMNNLIGVGLYMV